MFSKIRRDIEGAFRSFQNRHSIQVYVENDIREIPKKGDWIRVTYDLTTAEQIGFGNQNRIPGSINIQVFTDKPGRERLDTIADLINKTISDKHLASGVATDQGSFVIVGTDNASGKFYQGNFIVPLNLYKS